MAVRLGRPTDFTFGARLVGGLAAFCGRVPGIPHGKEELPRRSPTSPGTTASRGLDFRLSAAGSSGDPARSHQSISKAEFRSPPPTVSWPASRPASALRSFRNGCAGQSSSAASLREFSPNTSLIPSRCTWSIPSGLIHPRVRAFSDHLSAQLGGTHRGESPLARAAPLGTQALFVFVREYRSMRKSTNTRTFDAKWRACG